MGQKKRASASRHVASSNGSLCPAASGPLDGAGSPVIPDLEQSRNGSGTACNIAGGCLTNEAPVANGAGGMEGPKSGGEEPSNVKGDCEKALVALRRGNSTKALKLIRDACSRFDGNALVQRVRGHICMRLASVIEDSTTKQRHLKEAIEAARKAVLLSPQSVEYAHFLAQLLFEAAVDSKGYEEVVQECQRALAIQDPVDPAKESLHEEGQHKLPTPEARIAHAQQELRSLVQKANIASISNWMKTLGNGASEEKLRFIQMRKLVEDPMEQRISQPKRPHEVKKSVKTPEERRKEIEVRVAAARLLQQKNECLAVSSEDGTATSAKVGPRLERRKSAGSNSRKVGQAVSTEERIERLRPFWSAIGAQEREIMLEVSLEALKNQLLSSKVSLSWESFMEALEFARGKKTWRFWMCCICGEKFIDCQEHAQHIMQEHIVSLPARLRSVLPGEIDQDMADQIMDEDCRPFDGPAAIKLLIESSNAVIREESAEEQLCSEVSNAGFDCSSEANTLPKDSRYINLGVRACQNLATVASDTATTAETSFNAPLDEDVEQGLKCHKSHVCNGECQRPKTVQQLGMRTHELPYADDDERTKLLQRIYTLFRILIRNKCLAADHMEKIVHYAIDELQSLVPHTSVQYEFNHSPLYIRFLPAQQLRRILKFIRELVKACGLDWLSEHSSPPVGSQNDDEDVIQDRLFLNEDFTTLALDERLLKDSSAKSGEVSLDNDNSVKQQAGSKGMDALSPLPPPLTMVKNGKNISHADLQLSWIYGTADYEYQPVDWKQLREAQAEQGRDVFRNLEKEFLTLQNLCEKHLHYEEAINMAKRLCIEELKKREPQPDGSLQSYEAVLKKRQQELLEGRAHDSAQWKLELDMITTILREAQTVNLPHFPYDGALSVTSSRLSDSDEEDEGAWRVQEFIHRTDSAIEVVVQRQKEHFTSEVNKLDARILRAMDNVQRLEHKLGSISVLDYRAVVLPLVKSFLQVQLEDAADKDALQKSDAAQEAFLAELSRDGKTAAERMLDSSKFVKEKYKEKKKSKEQRKPKDGKRVSGIGLESQHRNILEGSPLDSEDVNILDDDDGLEWDIIEETRQDQEAEIRRQAELEAEERKLAETLELQRRVEEEAKEKHLAELRKKQAEKEAKGLSFVLGGSLSDDKCNSSSQNKSEIHRKHLPPDSLTHSATLHIMKDAHQSFWEEDSVSTINSSFNGSLNTNDSLPTGTAHFRNSEAVESLSSCSLQSSDVISPEQGSHVLSTKDARDRACYDASVWQLEAESVDGQERSCRKPVISSDSESRFVNPPKIKKSGKNRRKRIVRTQEDSNQSSSKEGQSSGVKPSENGVRASDGVNVVSNATGVEGNKMLYEAGSMQTSVSSVNRRKKHSIVYDGALLDGSGRTAHTSSKTLRQLKAEQDAEERFQADLEQAMRQSLDSSTESSQQVQQTKKDCLISVVSENQSRSEEIGKGLQNEIGQYNCFLNVVIQSLWHLRKFREELLAASSMHHVHVGDPCVVCALRDIFVGLNAPLSDSSKEAIAPTTLRVALSTLSAKKEFFQEAQMNDASEVLAVVFECLHKAFSLSAILSDGDSDTSSGVGSWECHDSCPCIAHGLFGLDISMQMNCQACGLESRHHKYTSFFHIISASSLRTAKIMYQGSSLDEVLKLVEMNHHLACDVEMGGCGKKNYIHQLLRAAPHVFTTVLGWQNNCESIEDISATVDAIEVEVDVGVVYRGLDEGFKHRLVSVVCYYGQHYHCFAFNHEVGKWGMFDDTTVKVVGGWKDVADTCRRGHLQPQVLFYEAVAR